MDHQQPQRASDQALLAAQSLELALLFDEAPNDNQDASLRLLGFCMAELGRRHQTLEPLPGGSIEKLLNHNDIHHRRVEVPRHPHQDDHSWVP